MTCQHWRIEGRVQGVGYRWWCEAAARRRGLDGWVRNRRDGAVEVMVCGGAEDLLAFMAECRIGPTAALVRAISVMVEDSPDRQSLTGSGFRAHPTA